MKKYQSILLRLVFPPIALPILLTPVAIAGLIYALAILGGDHPVCYFCYIVAFYVTMVWSCRIPRLVHRIIQIKEQNRYVHRLVTDTPLRIMLSLYGSLIYNSAYGFFQLALGFYHASFWYISLAVYYILLAVMRFYLLHYTRMHKAGADRFAELQRYRFCGIVFLLMNLALSVMVFFMIAFDRGVVHPQIITIAIAAYTFTALTVAIVNVIKYRKYNSPVYSATKAVSLASALVSLLTLESAMLSAFSEEGQEVYNRTMTGMTGAGVMLVILGMAVIMIRNANREMKALKNPRQET